MDNINEQNISSGIKVTLIGSIANILLVAVKLYIGFISRSQALIADGFHSLSDLFSDVVVFFGLKWGRKEADHDHPFGHGRIETLSGMIVGLILFLVGVGLAFNAVNSLYTGEYSQPSLPAIFAAAISIIVKETLYWYTIVVAKKLKSQALFANAWHHRSDALSSIAVLVWRSTVFTMFMTSGRVSPPRRF